MKEGQTGRFFSKSKYRSKNPGLGDKQKQRLVGTK